MPNLVGGCAATWGGATTARPPSLLLLPGWRGADAHGRVAAMDPRTDGWMSLVLIPPPPGEGSGWQGPQPSPDRVCPSRAGTLHNPRICTPSSHSTQARSGGVNHARQADEAERREADNATSHGRLQSYHAFVVACKCAVKHRHFQDLCSTVSLTYPGTLPEPVFACYLCCSPASQDMWLTAHHVGVALETTSFSLANL